MEIRQARPRDAPSLSRVHAETWKATYVGQVPDVLAEERIVKCVETNLGADPRGLLEALFADVRKFTRGTPQSDDITAMVLRYGA